MSGETDGAGGIGRSESLLAPVAAGVVGVVPARLADTRPGAVTIDGQSAATGPLGENGVLTVPVLGRGGVPADGVGSVAVNVTIAQPSASSYLTAYPSGADRPNTSTVNFAPGAVTANFAIVAVGADGSVNLFNRFGTVHVIVDVVGWIPGTTMMLSEPSLERLANGTPTITGATSLPDERWITIGTADDPGAADRGRELASNVHANVVGGAPRYGVYQLRWATASAAESGAALLGSMADVAVMPSVWNEPISELREPPGDWSDDGVDATWPFDQIDARAAWDMTTGSSTAVGIVDTGTVFRGHEDLSVTFAAGVPAVSTGQHATHVAGLACARANGRGLVGVGWGCPILSAGLTSTDPLKSATWYSAFFSMVAVAESGARVVNSSIGFNFAGCASDEQVRKLTEEMSATYGPLFYQLLGGPLGQSIVWVFAAGNSCANGTTSPMAMTAISRGLSNVLVVAATNSDGTLASFSNHSEDGAGPGGPGAFWVAAPGGVRVPPGGDGASGLWSTVPSRCAIAFTCSSYSNLVDGGPARGTSQAAPLVAGTAALVRERFPNLSAVGAAMCIVNGAQRAGRRVTMQSPWPAGYPRPNGERFVAPVYPVPGLFIVSAAQAVSCPGQSGTSPAASDVRLLWEQRPTAHVIDRGLTLRVTYRVRIIAPTGFADTAASIPTIFFRGTNLTSNSCNGCVFGGISPSHRVSGTATDGLYTSTFDISNGFLAIPGHVVRMDQVCVRDYLSLKFETCRAASSDGITVTYS